MRLISMRNASYFFSINQVFSAAACHLLSGLGHDFSDMKIDNLIFDLFIVPSGQHWYD